MTFGSFGSFVFVGLLLAAAPVAAQNETIVEVRVHGNHSTPDAEVLRIAGLSTGQPFTDALIAATEKKLRDSGRFEDAEVLKRYRSIASLDDILVMVVVDEHPATTADDVTPGPFKKFRAASMWMPILSYADGYGFTYGAQTAFSEPLGRKTKLKVPLTWGGERRAAAILEREFESGPVDTLSGTLSVNRRVNPFFLESDRRYEIKIAGHRRIVDWLNAGASARFTDNRFGPIDDRTRAVEAHVTFDTRLDPNFPRNAILVTTGIERMAFDTFRPAPGAGRTASRWTSDLRGYIAVGPKAVVALRVSGARANAPLPFFEQALLGGGDSVRGYRTGHRAGDNAASASGEVRYLLTSPISQGRLGVKGFVDAGTVWMRGERWQDQILDRGIGGGVFFGIGPLTVNLDVAKPRVGNVRGHFGMGLSF